MARALPWSNQDLLLFHGTTLHSALDIVEHGVDVSKGKPDCDFGRGFYCTTSEAQAREWSRIKGAREHDAPAVVSIGISRELIGDLRSLVFVRGDQEASDYWSFVTWSRTAFVSGMATPTLPYDIVYGPVALPWFQQKVKPDSDQISFHSTAAQKVLNAEAKRGMLTV